MLLALLQTIIDGFVAALKAVIKILPTSPFQMIWDYVYIEFEWMQALNYIIPLDVITALLEAWGLAVAGFYIYMIFMRWVKAIE